MSSDYERGGVATAEDLAAAAQRGSKASFAALAERFGPRLYSYFRNRVRSREDCEDLVQETLIRAYENIERYSGRHAFATWIFTIGTRLMVDFFRSRQRGQRPAAAPPARAEEKDPADILARQEREERFWALLRELPRRQYDVLWLRYTEEMPVKEIARTLGLTRVHVKVLLFRARARVADLRAAGSAAGRGEQPAPASIPRKAWSYR